MNTDQIENLLLLSGGGGLSPANRDRRKGIAATDLERRKAGSPAMRAETVGGSEEKREKEEEEETEEDDVAEVEEQAQGRVWWQLGQSAERRSRRQEGQTPHTWRRLEGCFGHFHTSSSSA